MRSFTRGLALFFIFSTLAFARSDLDSQKMILQAINHYRAEQGKPALALLYPLSREAEQHSEDMAARRVAFGHEGFEKRLQRAFKQYKHSKGFAENVAYNYGEPQQVVEQWLHSRGHRKNIEGNYNYTGLGLAWDRDGRVYVTQVFLRA